MRIECKIKHQVVESKSKTKIHLVIILSQLD